MYANIHRVVAVRLLAFLLLLGSFGETCQAAHYKLFVLTGQSNSLGTTNGGEADPSPGPDAADARIPFFWHNVADAATLIGSSGGSFLTLQPQQGGYYPGSATHWGPEMNFGRTLFRAGVRNFGIIKASRGGGGNTNWSKASAGHMYSHVVTTVTAATTDLTTAGHTFEIVGLLYVQGESDTSAEAEIAGTRFKELVDNLRADLPNAAQMRGVIGGIAAAGTIRDTVREKQQTIAEQTAYIDYFSNLDLQGELPDNLHFNKVAKLRIGERFAMRYFSSGTVARHYGKLVFIGDSITQGGNGNYPSYRYQIFKRLAENAVPMDPATGYEFVGSVTGAYQNSVVTTPDVNGQIFENVHDGHFGWRASWESARVPLPATRYLVNNLGQGTLWNWTGTGPSPSTYQTADEPTTKPYTGITYTPDTAVILIGINDLADGVAPSRVRDDIATLIDQLRGSNPNVRVHLNQVLRTNQGATRDNQVSSLNSLLPALVADKNAASSTSPVWLVDAATGFDPAGQTYDGIHPNAGGEAWVGDRMAAALGVVESPLTTLPPPPTASPSVKMDSENFSTKFEGNQIWNGSEFRNGWSQTGSLAKSLPEPTNLRVESPGSGDAWLEGTGSGWTAANNGSWTFEIRLKFNANPNGFMVWLGTGSQRILVEIHGGYTQDNGNNTFRAAHNNLDGQFHTFRIAHDAGNAKYHVWRDGERLTPSSGVAYDGAAADSRVILGDYTSGTFGNGFDVEIDHVRYDQTGAYIAPGDFPSNFEGNEIWNGSEFRNGWSQSGALTKSLPEPTNLRVESPGSGGAWLEGTGSGWSLANHDSWTFEIRLKFNANPNGYMVWLGTGSQRILMEIYGDHTQDNGNNTFRAAHNNLDGQFHTFRIAHDAANAKYHVWRDGERLTPSEGVTYDGAAADSRMILGDYTSGTFGNGFDVEIDHVRYDQTGAYPAPDPDSDDNGVAAPAAPADLTATAGGNSVALGWSASPTAESYHVKRATTAGGPYSTIASGIVGSDYSDSGLNPGDTYHYVVSAMNEGGESLNSPEASATLAPAPPDRLTASAGDSRISLEWDASAGTVGYSVHRATTRGGPYSGVASGLAGTSYIDTALSNGTTYFYVVTASNSGGTSDFSNEAGATPQPPAPDAPSDLVAKAGNLEISLAWSASSGAASYLVKRSTVSGGPYETIAYDIPTPDYTDTGLTNDVTYFYVVAAVNGGGASPDSNEASASPLPAAAYSGRAIAAGVHILGSDFVWADTGELPTEGGTREATFLTLNEIVLAGEIGHALTIGQADRTRSEASVGEVSVNVGGLIIESGFTMSRALAVYQAGGTTGLAGGAEITDLTIAGVPVIVTGDPNQEVALPNGKLVVNEQTRTDESITVNALHILLDDGGEFLIASARAGYQSLDPPVIEGDDRISGGGWIPLASGGKGTFGASGGHLDGELSGHLTFKDHVTGMMVKATSVSAYRPGATPNSRRVEGSAEINGTGGFTYAIEAADNGEPGDADTFSIDLSNGYQAQGLLGGGNIQLHHPGN